MGQTGKLYFIFHSKKNVCGFVHVRNKYRKKKKRNFIDKNVKFSYYIYNRKNNNKKKYCHKTNLYVGPPSVY